MIQFQETKICKICLVEKPLSEYYFRKESNKYRNECKECVKKRSMKFHYENKEKIKTTRKKYYELNKTDFKKAVLNNYYKNRSKRLLQMQKWRIKNWDSVKKKDNEKVKKYLKNPEFRFLFNMRRRINYAIKNNRNSKLLTTKELLGCDIKTARKHIEKQFVNGMSWDNYGFYGWHIDHIIPLSSFNLLDPEQQKIAFNYKNLQPLWAHDNLSKGKKIIGEKV